MFGTQRIASHALAAIHKKICLQCWPWPQNCYFIANITNLYIFTNLKSAKKLALCINSSFIILAVPVYFWPLLKTTAGQTRGTDHAVPHGHVRQVQGGIELNGVDAWLDGGDFHGKCFSDPELCIKGLSVAMQVC